jgi:capsular exopolysaccharide synthesis family protein
VSKKREKLAEYQRLKMQEAAAKASITRLRSVYAMAEAKLRVVVAEEPVIPDLATIVESDPSVAQARMPLQRMEQLLRREAAIRGSYNHPNVQDYAASVDSQKAAVEQARKAVRDRVILRAKTEQTARYQEAVERAKVEIEIAESEMRQVGDQLVNYKDVEQSEDQKDPVNYDEINSKIAQYKQLKEKIDWELKMLQVELQAPERVTLRQPAEVPAKADLKKRFLASAGGGVGGFFLVGAAVGLLEMRRRRVYGRRDSLFRDRVKLLGVIPEEFVTPGKAPQPGGMALPGRAFLESVDKVKTVIDRMSERKRLQVLVVTSASPDEGKSIVAWTLALSLARGDRKTLFIDANLTKPTLQEHVRLSPEPGLSEVLRGDATPPEALRRTAIDCLWCMPAGAADDAAREALDKDRLRRLIDKLRDDFDQIVIDTASLQESVDPLYLARRSDGTVLAVRSYRSRTTGVERACERLDMVGAPLLGAVLSDPAPASEF